PIVNIITSNNPAFPILKDAENLVYFRASGRSKGDNSQSRDRSTRRKRNFINGWKVFWVVKIREVKATSFCDYQPSFKHCDGAERAGRKGRVISNVCFSWNG